MHKGILAMLKRKPLLKRKCSGATYVEYLLLVSLVAIAVLSTVYLVGDKLENKYQNILEEVELTQ
jgi:Flp pilus assembly pilin Flp